MAPTPRNQFSVFRVIMATILVLSIIALLISIGVSSLFLSLQGKQEPGWEGLSNLVVFAYIGVPAFVAAIVSFLLALIGSVSVAIAKRRIPWVFGTLLLLNLLAGVLPFFWLASTR
jgi:hypothetical protein